MPFKFTDPFFMSLAVVALAAVAACQQSAPPAEPQQESPVENSTTGAAVKLEPTEAKPNEYWWPKSLNLKPLRDNSPESNPLGSDFNYQAEFAKVDYTQLKEDLEAILTRLRNLGVRVLRTASHHARQDVQVIGVDDRDDALQVERELSKLEIDQSAFNILMYHRPRGLEAAANYALLRSVVCAEEDGLT